MIMSISFRYTYNKFTAGEAERITGVSAMLQRDWRRRKYLPAGRDGWKQYELADLAQLVVMGALQDRGIGPSRSCEIASSAALRIEFFALSWTDAIDDQTGGEFERIIKKTNRPRGGFFVGWSNSPDEPRRYLVAWADRSMGFTSDLNQSFDGYTWDERFRGAIIVMDLESLGTLIMERAGRPLARVEVVEKLEAPAE